MSFYIFCGGDGRGKTTVSKLIANMLGVPYFKFPYGSDGDTKEEIYSGTRIRAILNDQENTCDPVAFQALQLINKLEAISILRELERKYGIVIVDRWSLSALIYGEVDGVDRIWNEKICKMFDDQIKPTIMFIFTGKSFKTDNDIYGAKQSAIAQLYDDYCQQHVNTDNVVEINITGKSIEAVALEVLGYITRDMLKNRTLSVSSGTLSFVGKPKLSNFVLDQHTNALQSGGSCKEPDYSKPCYDSKGDLNV